MDAENYKKQKDSFKQTILEHHKYCITAASQLIQVERDDLLKWINSVDAFAMALSSHILEHPEIKEKFEINETQVNQVLQEYESHYHHLKNLQTENQKVNQAKLMKTYQDKLLKLIREKFVILTMLLHKKNYFEEISYIDGLDDMD